MNIIIMGVSGPGKTTIGKLLATRLRWEFSDADDFHPVANLEKMKRGEPLTDDDRMPWLTELNRRLRKDSVVLACSALKAAYRMILDDGNRSRFVFLRVDRQTARERLRERKSHFMNPSLIDSQFDALEEPAGAFVVDAAMPEHEIIREIVRGLSLAAPAG